MSAPSPSSCVSSSVPVHRSLAMLQKRARPAAPCPCLHRFVLFVAPTPLFTHAFRPATLASSSPLPSLRTPRQRSARLVTPSRLFYLSPTATLATPAQEGLTDVDPRILSAVASLARQDRLTVPDVAAAAGVPLELAQEQVVTLANLVGAAIDVTDAGVLAYRFPSDVKGKLRRKSWRAALRMGWERVFPTLFTSVRVAFGGLLILSIVVTFVALAALASAARSDDDRRDSRGGGGSFLPVRLFAPDIFDVMFYSRRPRYSYYTPPPRGRGTRGGGESDMSFLEAVYSFVFGDGNPNVGIEERRWRRVAAVIRTNRGAVTAEQLAPFLDISRVPNPDADVVDESYVLPALQRFHGHPEVTDAGDIIYVFPSLAETGSRAPSVEFAGQAAGAALVEQELSLTRAPATQRALVVALGVVNVLGVLALCAQLGAVRPLSSDALALVQGVKAVFPALAAYAASFVAFPVARWWRMRRVNAEIRARNAARAAAALSVARPSEGVRAKVREAQKWGREAKVVGGSDVVYSSDRDVLEQGGGAEEEFDRRLRGGAGGR